MATLDSVELDELEQRIIDRTTELEAANRKLQQEIVEREHADEEIRLLLAITQTIDKAENFTSALQTTLAKVCEATGWNTGEVWLPSSDGTVLEYGTAVYVKTRQFKTFQNQSKKTTFAPGIGLPGRVWTSKAPEWIPDASIPNGPFCVRRDIALEVGLKAALAIPIVARDRVLAVLTFFMFRSRTEDTRLIEMISAIALQLGSVIQHKQAGEALRQSEARLTLAQEAADIGTWDWDVKSGQTHWSSHQFHLHGIAPTDNKTIGYDKWLGLIHLDNRDKAAKDVATALEDGQGFTTEYRIVWPDGQTRWLDGKARVIRDDNGTPIRMIGVNIDITERKRAEERLRESEERFALVAQGSHDALWFCPDVNNESAEWWSPRWYEMLGYNEHELKASLTNFRALLHPDDRLKHEELMRAHLETQVPYDMEYRLKTKSGEYRWYRCRAQAVWDEHGNPTKMAGSLRDITDRKRAEEALRDSEERFRSAFEQGSLGMAFIDSTYRVLAANRTFCDMVGYSSQELLGQTFAHMTHPDDLNNNIRLAEQLFDNVIPSYQLEKRYIHKSGTIVWVRLTATIIREGRDRQPISFAMIENITKRKHAEDQLRASHQRLRNLAAKLQVVREEERTIIAREVHDEMGQTLTALKMDLAWTKKSLPKRWKAVPDRLRSMISLIDSTLTTVRQLSSRLRPAMLDDLGLEATIEWQVQEFTNRGDYRCQLDLKAVGLRPNKQRDIAVYRILQEALTNIARHASANRIDIKLWTEDEELLLVVKDDGKGISDEALTSTYSLGLTGMYERARMLDGSLKIERGARDKGTVLTLKVPLTSTKRLAHT